MKKGLLTLALTFCTVIFTSCGPQLSFVLNSDNSVDVSFSADFSKEAAQTLSELAGAASGLSDGTQSAGGQTQFVSESDVKAFFEGFNLENVVAKVNRNNSIFVSGKIKNLNGHVLSSTGILTLQGKSLDFSLTPVQFEKIYSILDQDSKGYLDLLMAPVFMSEESGCPVEEYGELLEAVYGPELAKEFVNGSFKVKITAPAGKKEKTVSLGKLLTDKTGPFFTTKSL